MDSASLGLGVVLLAVLVFIVIMVIAARTHAAIQQRAGDSGGDAGYPTWMGVAPGSSGDCSPGDSGGSCDGGGGGGD